MSNAARRPPLLVTLLAVGLLTAPTRAQDADDGGVPPAPDPQPEAVAADAEAPQQSAITVDADGRWLTACGAGRLIDDPDPHPANRCQAHGGQQPDPAPQSVSVCRTNDHFGANVALGGDFDGDGRPDLAVAGLNRLEQADASTEVWVLPGDGGRPLLVIEGNGRNDLLGAALAFVPDTDGDGRDELAIGAPTHGLSGRVYVVKGRADQAGARVKARASASVILEDATPSSRFGSSLCVLDLDGDGRPDLAVGAPGCDAGDRSGWNGAVFLFDADALGSGEQGQTLLLSSRHARRVLRGEREGARFGAALAAVTTPGAAAPDRLAVGAPATRGETLDRITARGLGEVLMFDGDGESARWVVAGPLNAAFGWRLSGGHDLDGDGVTDLAVGAPLWSPSPSAGARDADADAGGSDPRLGAAWLLSGADGSAWLGADDSGPALTGAGRFGGALALGADLTGDGRPDLLLAAPLDSPANRGCSRHGSFHRQGGAMAGSITLVDGATCQSVLQLVGEAGRDRFGFAVAAGDLDGDGLPEVLGGAAGWSPPGGKPNRTLLKEVGRAYLFDGAGLGGD